MNNLIKIEKRSSKSLGKVLVKEEVQDFPLGLTLCSYGLATRSKIKLIGELKNKVLQFFKNEVSQEISWQKENWAPGMIHSSMYAVSIQKNNYTVRKIDIVVTFGKGDYSIGEYRTSQDIYSILDVLGYTQNKYFEDLTHAQF